MIDLSGKGMGPWQWIALGIFLLVLGIGLIVWAAVSGDVGGIVLGSAIGLAGAGFVIYRHNLSKWFK